MKRQMFKWKVLIPEQEIEVHAMYPHTAKERALRFAEGIKTIKIEEKEG